MSWPSRISQGGVVAVVAGETADRYGNLWVLLAGVVCCTAGMWAMAHAATEDQIMSMTGLLVGTGVAGTSFGIVLFAFVWAISEARRG